RVRRPDLRALPAAAQPRRVSGDGDRSCHLQEGRGAPRRTDLAGVGTREGDQLPLHHTRSSTHRRRMSARPLSRPVEILLVEDNPGDVRLTREALREGKVRNNLYVASDGVEALAFLRREGEFADAVRPDLILLDLNLPRKD